MLLNTVKDAIRKHSLLSPGDRVLVAVSGGPDSVCLLSVLHALSKELKLSLHVAHLDHMFRGKESADEALFVAGLARNLGIPATVEQFDVPAFCRERGLSPQAGAREARYAFLEKTAQAAGASRIATGHTATDQAETFLMRLIRGAGVAGLSAIPPVRGNVIRPLLGVTREHVMEYLDANRLLFKTDPSNATHKYTRNRVRLSVLPVLLQFNPRIVETLANEAALLRDEDEAVNSHLASVIETAFVREGGALSIKRDVFDTQPPAFRRRLLRTIMDQEGVDSAAISRGRIDEALSFMLSTQTGRSLRLTPDITITREYNRFLFSMPAAPAQYSHALAVPGACIVPQSGITVETTLGKEDAGDPSETNYRWQAAFDYAKIGPSLLIRNRRPGDVFCPSGMGGRHKKLQDFFVDEKVPQSQRDRVPLLCTDRDIIWIIGMRTDERFLAGPETTTRVNVTVQEPDQ